MGQTYALVNVDKRLREYWGKYREYICTTSMALPLALDIQRTYFQKVLVTFKALDMRQDGKRPSLLRLPTELVDAIFEHLPDASFDSILDTVCLAVTCRHLWTIGERHVLSVSNTWLRQHSWAGDRIILVGEYILPKELPKGLLSVKELGQLKEASKKAKHPSTSFSGMTYDVYHEYDGPTQRVPDVLRLLEKRDVEGAAMSVLQKMAVGGGGRIARRTEGKTMRVLRNLSKHVFVREEALVPFAKGFRSPINWGNIIACLVGWGQGEVYASWAGSRIDIVVAAVFEEERKGGGEGEWRDVSEKVAKLAQQIWRDNDGW